jgi:membrane associated rhomboid family serine protease
MVDTTGFYGAPVTKFLCALTLGSFGISNWFEKKQKYLLTIKQLGSPVHVITSTFLFSSFGEVLCGLFLLYTFRQLERKMGSIKFASYTLISATLGLTIQLAFLVCFSPRRLAPGPLPIIGSLLIPFFAHIPKLSPRYFSILGVDFSDKTFTYILALQLLFNDGISSFASGLAGFLVGVVYSAEVLPLHSWRIPSFVSNAASRFIMPWIGSNAPWVRDARRAEYARRQQQAMNRVYENAGIQPANSGTDQLIGGPDPALLQALRNSVGTDGQQRQQMDQPAEILISQMTNMGFSREDSINALQQTNNNVSAAVERLLSR